MSILENSEIIIGQTINEYTILESVGKGAIGRVYRAERKDVNDPVAIKVIPLKNLPDKWEEELKKAGKLNGVPEFVQYKYHFFETIKSNPHIFIVLEYVNGSNLAEYCSNHPKDITMPFIKNFAIQMLRGFYSMEIVNESHEDLHEGNILIAQDSRVLYEPLRIRITDFGTGFKSSNWDASDDYYQLALICNRLLEKYIDPAELNAEDRFLYDKISHEFLKKLLENDPTAPTYERYPEKLIQYLENLKRVVIPKPVVLVNPFDYLSCEQIGNSFELLQLLYSQDFLGNQDLTQRTNTILTGPRGCGKTTIFRNLSFKTKVLANRLETSQLDQFIGVYYQCSDLYYAFPYLDREPSEDDKRVIVHYFNLGLLYEVLDTFSSLEKFPDLALNRKNLLDIEDFLRWFLPKYQSPPAGTNILSHLKSVVELEKTDTKKWLESKRQIGKPEVFLPLDFVKRFCTLLENSVSWLKNRVFYFFVDDFSLPRISKTIQVSLFDFILDRNAECFFKISTESVTTLYTVDSHGKLLEDTREYDLIDLGTYFLHSSTSKKREFLKNMVNNRLSKAEQKYPGLSDVESALKYSSFSSYNDLARAIRDSKKRVLYHGWDTLVDICSGDISIFLRIIRDIFSTCRDLDKLYCSSGVPADVQDRAIRDNASDFLHRIETAPETGQTLRRVAEAFGDVANWYLRNLNSGNQESNPPWQAFRIEIRGKMNLTEKNEKIYSDLLKYGVFLRESRGKSQRGAVVPRLYLRRLLIPTFKLTPNQRDNIGIEADEFELLLNDSEAFSKLMKNKQHSLRSDIRQMKWDHYAKRK